MKQAWHHSRVASTVTTVLQSVGTALQHSRTRDILDTLLDWTSKSALARWLTAQSNPVTVDLRDTYTVGPLLQVSDRLRAAVAETPMAATAHGWEQAGTSLLEHRPVVTACLAVLVALVTNTLVTATLGDLTRAGLGLRFVAMAPFLLGLRSRATSEDVRASVLGRLLEPRTRQERENE